MSVRTLTRSTWKLLPPPAKRAVKATWAGFARITAGARLLPDYLIIGTQRGGTTSLYNYLVQHPALSHALTKEVRFFDLNYEKGLHWYRARFPSARYKAQVKRRDGVDLVVGEASPDYMFNPHAPGRVAADLPEVKLIVLLRNPIDRAFSHYWHQRTRGHETLTFDEAVGSEPERLEGELEKMLANDGYVSYERHHHSYLSRGLYADQLTAWFALFPQDRFLIESSERFFDDPAGGFRRALAFLGLPHWELSRYDVFNAFTSGQMEPKTRERLARFFQPHNHRLYAMIDDDLGWEGLQGG